MLVAYCVFFFFNLTSQLERLLGITGIYLPPGIALQPWAQGRHLQSTTAQFNPYTEQSLLMDQGRLVRDAYLAPLMYEL